MPGSHIIANIENAVKMSRRVIPIISRYKIFCNHVTVKNVWSRGTDWKPFWRIQKYFHHILLSIFCMVHSGAADSNWFSKEFEMAYTQAIHRKGKYLIPLKLGEVKTDQIRNAELSLHGKPHILRL